MTGKYSFPINIRRVIVRITATDVTNGFMNKHSGCALDSFTR